MKLSVVIVSYNVRYYLEQCLCSLRQSLDGTDAEVFVVDNHSHDNSVEYLRKRFPNVKYVSLNHNLGFSRANNIAIRQSAGEYVLLLNPDTIVGENVIRQCLEFMDSHRDAGSLGVQMIKCDGTVAMESRRGLPTPMVSLYKMTGLCRRFPCSRRFGRYYMSYLPWDRPSEIEVVSGAFCLLRRSVLDDVGLLDEDYFMYGEDIDLSCRILKGGYKNWYIPCRILHYKGESTQKSSFRYVHVFYDAMFIFFRKHYGHLTSLLRIPIKSAIYLKAMLALMKMLYTRMRKSLGFIPFKCLEKSNYIFIGRQEAIERCREIAAANGLTADFYVADSETFPDGHLSLACGSVEHPTYVVYDTGAYSYARILDIFSRKPTENIFIGTYNGMTDKIITNTDVIIQS